MSDDNDLPEMTIRSIEHLIEENFGDVPRLKKILDMIKREIPISKDDQDYYREISIKYVQEKEKL